MFRTAFLAKRMIITVLCRENYYVFILGLFAVIMLYFNGQDFGFCDYYLFT